MHDKGTSEEAWGWTQQLLARKLEALKANIRPLIVDVMELEARLKEMKERGEVLARQAFGVLLALGSTEEDARKEMQLWRSSAS